ncbi:MAG TPA: VOC family protein [Vicinamibacterales bacterium]|nr:VOC family protein [Vicinamibacterales bacterium]
MQMNAYLSFRGDCEAAFTFYAECLGGTVGQLFRYAGSPMATDVPDDWQNKIMHGSVTVGGQVFMGGDVAPERYESPKGFSFSLHLDEVAQAERIFHRLADGGRIVMPLEKTFWAARFGMLIDRFGMPWLVNCGTPND